MAPWGAWTVRDPCRVSPLTTRILFFIYLITKKGPTQYILAVRFGFTLCTDASLLL